MVGNLKVSIKRDESMDIDGINVPDPYYGGDEGFENVYQMLDEAVQKWLNELVD